MVLAIGYKIRPQSPVDYFEASVGLWLRQPTKLNHKMGVHQACTTYLPRSFLLHPSKWIRVISSNPYLSYCDVVSDVIVCMCVKVESTF